MHIARYHTNHGTVPEAPEALEYHPDPKGRRLYVIGCPTCEAEKEAGNTFFPPHRSSGRCQSGRRPHCSCSSCF